MPGCSRSARADPTGTCRKCGAWPFDRGRFRAGEALRFERSRGGFGAGPRESRRRFHRRKRWRGRRPIEEATPIQEEQKLASAGLSVGDVTPHLSQTPRPQPYPAMPGVAPAFHGWSLDRPLFLRTKHRSLSLSGWRRRGEDLVPLAEGLIAGDDEAQPLVALDCEFEQDGGFGLICAHRRDHRASGNRARRAWRGARTTGSWGGCLELLDEVPNLPCRPSHSVLPKGVRRLALWAQ